MISLHQNISKEEIGKMPRAVFKGKIVVIDSETEARKASAFLRKQPVVGIDTETRPSFRKGVSYQVALLQVATDSVCFLFRLDRIGLCEPVRKLLSNRKTLKVGLSLHDDLRSLRKRGDFRTGKYLDIQDIVPEFGIRDLSLQKIYANIFGEKISKTQRLSNWEAPVLSESQKTYAATDAWACIRIYHTLKSIWQHHDYTLIENNDDQQENISEA